MKDSAAISGYRCPNIEASTSHSYLLPAVTRELSWLSTLGELRLSMIAVNRRT